MKYLFPTIPAIIFIVAVWTAPINKDWNIAGHIAVTGALVGAYFFLVAAIIYPNEYGKRK